MKDGWLFIAVMFLAIGLFGSCKRLSSPRESGDIGTPDSWYYQRGYEAGITVGKRDALGRKPRNDRRVLGIAEANSYGTPADQKQYKFGFQQGYIDGLNEQRKVQSQ